MSAEVLREAAAKMRGRAEAAKATGAWEWRGSGGETWWAETTRAGRFIQDMGPDVALAVATLLDREAEVTEEMQALSPEYAMGPNDPALAVARAYLGGAS